MMWYWQHGYDQSILSVYLKQGTVLDRIDFNVEQACIKTEDGLQQLQKVIAFCINYSF